MVVNADASSSRAGTLGPSGTFVTAGAKAGVQGGSDYQAAVQAASQGADGSVLLWIIASHQMAGQDTWQLPLRHHTLCQTLQVMGIIITLQIGNSNKPSAIVIPGRILLQVHGGSAGSSCRSCAGFRR